MSDFLFSFVILVILNSIIVSKVLLHHLIVVLRRDRFSIRNRKMSLVSI